MKVLVIGGGAREHALVRAIRAGDASREVLCAPGNGGIAADARCLPIAADDLAGLCAAATAERVDLVVIGPEVPLVAGLADELQRLNVLAYGPSRAAAQLEGSKSFSKYFMKRHGIPTAEFGSFDDPDAARAYVASRSLPQVVKADGLAAGKGVVVASDAREALEAVDAMMRRRVFGDAGARVLIEDRLTGQEASFHVIADGVRFVVLGAAQDHKRVGDGDAGPNTGGMGAYAPVPAVTAAVEAAILRDIVEPTFRGLRADGIVFRGTLFVGVMLTPDGPRVLEYNVRFGDPECAVLLARLDGDILELLQGAARGDLSVGSVRVRPGAALAVVMAAHGYPASVRSGDTISGLDAAASVEGVQVFHAGTKRDGDRVVTSGGRVLAVTAHGVDVAHARARAYDAVAQIHWAGEHHRSDIAFRALASGT